MDGYALRAADVPAAGTVLPVSQRIPAGSVGAAAAAGQRGAHLHRRADAGRRRRGRDAGAVRAMPSTAAMRVRVDAVPQRRASAIRRRGEDVQRGAVVLARGTRLTPQALGLAASVGAGAAARAAHARAWRCSPPATSWRCRASRCKPGAIYNSNRFTLRGLLQAAGLRRAIDLGIVPDRLDATRDALRAPRPQATT